MVKAISERRLPRVSRRSRSHRRPWNNDEEEAVMKDGEQTGDLDVDSPLAACRCKVCRFPGRSLPSPPRCPRGWLQKHKHRDNHGQQGAAGSHGDEPAYRRPAGAPCRTAACRTPAGWCGWRADAGGQGRHEDWKWKTGAWRSHHPHMHTHTHTVTTAHAHPVTHTHTWITGHIGFNRFLHTDCRSLMKTSAANFKFHCKNIKYRDVFLDEFPF